MWTPGSGGLDTARASYDTADLLRVIRELEDLMASVHREDGLAEMLLRLHAMAHAVINGAPMDVSTDGDTLPDLAQDLTMVLNGAIARLRAWVKRIEPLEALAARA